MVKKVSRFPWHDNSPGDDNLISTCKRLRLIHEDTE